MNKNVQWQKKLLIQHTYPNIESYFGTKVQKYITGGQQITTVGNHCISQNIYVNLVGVLLLFLLFMCQY